MINDRAEDNRRYRSSLIARLEAEEYAVRSLGLFESARGLLAAPAHFSTPVVSSNLRSNLAMLCFVWVRGLVILNGLGRHRRRRLLRLFLLVLLRANRRKAIAVQSYADYRYLRRHAGGARLHWVPGSGGTPRASGSGGSLIAVQRDNKLPLVAPDLRDLLQGLQGAARLDIVGCHDHAAVRRLFADWPVESLGFVAPESLFLSGGIFVQPSGYGDGFPHSLADAIASGMEIYIRRSEYIRYGLRRLGAGRRPLLPGWDRLTYGPELREATARATVDAEYARLLGAAADE